MTELWKYGLLIGVGAIAGFLNVNAGGGSSLTLPALIFLGLDSAVANGSNRISIFIQNIFAISAFHKEKIHQFRESLTYSLFTLPGVVSGSLMSIRVSDEWFQRILAMVMIGIVLTMFIPQARKVYQDVESKVKSKWQIYLALLFIGFYGGFIQVGVGFLLMAALYHLLRISLVYVNMHKVFIVMIYMIPSLLIFIVTGNIHWGFGIALSVGNAVGAWWGAKVQVKGGEKIIRFVLAAAIVIMATKLLNIF